MRIEEVRRVVELDARHGFIAVSPVLPGCCHLRRNRTRRCVGPGREPPQIAHRASPGAFTACQEDRADARDVAAFSDFVLDCETLIPPGVVRRTRTAQINDEAVASRRCRRVWRQVMHLYDGSERRVATYTSAACTQLTRGRSPRLSRRGCS